MGERLKVGVVGVGSLGQWHARIYSELETAELVGVYDVDPDRAAEIANRGQDCLEKENRIRAEITEGKSTLAQVQNLLRWEKV